MTTVHVEDRTHHSRDIAVEQAIAFGVRELSIPGERDGVWHNFYVGGQHFDVPLDEAARDWGRLMAEFVEGIAKYLKRQPSDVLRQISLWPERDRGPVSALAIDPNPAASVVFCTGLGVEVLRIDPAGMVKMRGVPIEDGAEAGRAFLSYLRGESPVAEVTRLREVLAGLADAVASARGTAADDDLVTWSELVNIEKRAREALR